MIIPSIALLLYDIFFGHVTPATHAEAACKALSASHPDQVFNESSSGNSTGAKYYLEATQDYWSQVNADIKPACVFLPTSEQEVSFAVKVLNKYDRAPWAVKGGGHNQNPGFSSTAGGVLLAFYGSMATTALSSDMLAHVRPGCRWSDVFDVLDPHNLSVVSGRLGAAGVAGVTLGGGLSFLSTAHVSSISVVATLSF